MNKRESARLSHLLSTLQALGFTNEEAKKLRRISTTLHRWHELECGTGEGQVSRSVERDEETGKPYLRVQFQTRSGYVDQRYPTLDRETGALKRLAAIMAHHGGNHCHNCEPDALQPCGQSCGHVVGRLSTYIQTDPRGAALYILRPGDVPEGEQADCYYSRGVCVY